jgi:hypothetical protein
MKAGLQDHRRVTSVRKQLSSQSKRGDLTSALCFICPLDVESCFGRAPLFGSARAVDRYRERRATGTPSLPRGYPYPAPFCPPAVFAASAGTSSLSPWPFRRGFFRAVPPSACPNLHLGKAGSKSLISVARRGLLQTFVDQSGAG